MFENATMQNRKSVKEFFSSLQKYGETAIYAVDYTNQFKRDVTLCYKRNLDLNLLETAIGILADKGKLPKEYRAHKLEGYKKQPDSKIIECHIQPDWLLVWLQNDNVMTLILIDSGTHADLFGI
jgi:mRNA interferase YafQ